MQLRQLKRIILQISSVLSQMSNPYPRNLSPQLETRWHLARHFRFAETRNVTIDLSRDATSVGLACGGAPREDFEMVMSDLQVG